MNEIDHRAEDARVIPVTVDFDAHGCLRIGKGDTVILVARQDVWPLFDAIEREVKADVSRAYFEKKKFDEARKSRAGRADWLLAQQRAAK